MISKEKTGRAVLRCAQVGIGHSARNGPLVEGIDFELYPGELVALLGLNGSGKSTLIRTMSGLIPALKGEVFLGSDPIKRLSALKRARRMAVVLTALPPIGETRVVDLLSLGRFAHQGWFGSSGADHDKVLEVARDLNLEPMLDQSLYQLSDGERQRVLIGRALVQDVPLILLDEPTHYLDVVQRAHIFNLLAALARRRQACLFMATHELEWALQHADRIALISAEGFSIGTRDEIRHSGKLERLYNSPSLRFDAKSGRFQTIDPAEGG